MTVGDKPQEPERPLRNLRLLVAYDGTDFHGFAASEGVRTVMGLLVPTIEQIVRRPVELTVAGRTDAGVHGWGQVVNAMMPSGVDLYRLVTGVNQLLRPEISVREPEWVDDDFSSRFSATSRSYRYDVWNDRTPNPLVARHVWHVGRPLDVEAMNTAAGDLLGDHDFSSFCRRPKPPPGFDEPNRRRVLQSATWSRVDDSPLLRFEVSASSFCHQMVRSIVGTLVDVGLGRRSSDSMPQILEARHRNAAGQIAPPTGLVLWHVSYLGPRWDSS